MQLIIIASLLGLVALGCAPASYGQTANSDGRICAAVTESYQTLDVKLTAAKSELEKLKAAHAADNEIEAKRVAIADLIYRQNCVRPDLQPDPVRGPATQPKWLTLTTYYATNRKPGPSVNGLTPYGADRDAVDLHFGRAEVSIPTNRKPGELSLPLNLILFELPADPSKDFIIKSVAPLDSNTAIAEMRGRLGQTSRKSVLLFVHGFNVSFNDAALRTAQLAHDLNFPGLPAFFSWPSAGRTSGYPRDEEMSKLSLDAFDQFMDQIATLGASDIYIVAHSMGNRVVTEALVRRVANHKPMPANLKGLLLAAPDINADIFREQIAPGLAALAGTSRTIYASNSDVALKASSVLHDFPRVGLTQPHVLTYAGFETVDATDVAPVLRGYGHSYVTDSPRVIRDMQALIFLTRNAQARGLSREGVPPSAFWVLH